MMEFGELLEHFAARSQGMNPQSCITLKQLISRRAAEKDGEISSLLLKDLIDRYAELERELIAKQHRIAEDLRAAGEVQRALLPKSIPYSECIHTAWKFLPCDRVGGDILNVFSPAPGTLCFFILDVSGHGVPSALIAVTALQTLRKSVIHCDESNGRYRCDISPKQMLEALDREFPFERFERHFTMVYGAIDEETGVLTYSSAGHPDFYLQRGQESITALASNGPVIGFGDTVPFEEDQITLRYGDRVLLYTDGIIECENGKGMPFGEERLLRHLQEHVHTPIDSMLELLISRVFYFSEVNAAADDISVLAIEYGTASTPERSSSA